MMFRDPVGRIPPQLSPLPSQSHRFGTMNQTCITFAHQPKDFAIDWHVGVDSEIHFALT